MDVLQALDQALGLHQQPKELGYLQVCLRALIVFIAALIIVRIADKRFLAKMAALDVILGFMLGSMLARAINGSATLFPSLVAGLLLALLHRLLATLAYRSEKVGKLIKGEADVLVERGLVHQQKLRAHKISEKDLYEELRLNGKTEDLQHVSRAVIERNGKISVVTE